MVNLYQQLLCKLYSGPLYNIVMDGLVYARRRYRRHRSYSGDGELSSESLLLFFAIVLVGAWLTFSKVLSKTLRYIIALIPVISAVVIFPFVISSFKIILVVAAGSVAGLFIFQHLRNSDAEYEGSFISAAAPDYLFTSGVLTNVVEILILII